MSGTRQDTGHIDFGFRLAMTNGTYQFVDAVDDFIVAVLSKVVGTHQEDNLLGLIAIQFSVIDAPQGILDAVPSEAKVTGNLPFEQFLPTILAIDDVGSRFTSPKMSNGITY